MTCRDGFQAGLSPNGCMRAGVFSEGLKKAGTCKT